MAEEEVARISVAVRCRPLSEHDAGRDGKGMGHGPLVFFRGIIKKASRNSVSVVNIGNLVMWNIRTSQKKSWDGDGEGTSDNSS